jgi:hypothetical protein
MTKKLQQSTGEIRFNAPMKLVGYLELLARDTLLGASANDVALALLTVEVERRLFADYHSKTIPVTEPEQE